MTTCDQIVDRLQEMGRKPKKNGQGWKALCPAHDDHNPSLSIWQENGAPALKCYAGCERSHVLEAIGLSSKDIMPSKSRASSSKPAARRIVATYDYTDDGGKVIYQSVRYKPKDFSQRRPDGRGGWISKEVFKGVQRVLYRLPELIEDVGQGRRIFVVEGEKDTNNVRAFGLAATTNVGGSGKWKTSYSETLRGAQICILPDNDISGRGHAEKVAASLHGVAAEVKILELPGLLKEKQDVSDWIAADGTAEELERLAANAPIWEPEQEAECSAGRNLNDLYMHVMAKHFEESKMYADVLEALKEKTQMSLEPTVAKALKLDSGPEVFTCTNDGCKRFFDTDQGRKLHETKGHK